MMYGKKVGMILGYDQDHFGRMSSDVAGKLPCQCTNYNERELGPLGND